MLCEEISEGLYKTFTEGASYIQLVQPFPSKTIKYTT